LVRARLPESAFVCVVMRRLLPISLPDFNIDRDIDPLPE
jgi:hypothetical protein